jgi:O-antigen/teichoic acid export membrane protein
MSTEQEQMTTYQKPSKTVTQRFAQNIVSETSTIIIAIVFGLATSILIVRGLPKTPVYEFYFYLIVFSWIGILLPICISGLDMALTKHIPEILGRRGLSLKRLFGVTLFSTLIISSLIVLIFWLLLMVFPGLLVANEVAPFFQLALLSLPLTGLSMVIQGVFRGIQEMRYGTYAMAFYHASYFLLLLGFFLFGALTLTRVILLNIGVSFATILIEIFMLRNIFRKYSQINSSIAQSTLSQRDVTSTAIQGLILALLGAIFLNAPLLITNLYRTSDVLLAGLGLALSVAAYIQRGQAAPFRALLPRTAGDVVIGNMTAIEGYVHRSLKLGTAFNGFIFSITIVFAAPILGFLFGEEGYLAVPFLILLSGSLLIYPLIQIIMETLIGLGAVRNVVITYGGWTALMLLILWVIGPLGREMFVATLWFVSLPFLFIFLQLYRHRTGLGIESRYLSRLIVVLLVNTMFSIGIFLIGFTAIQLFNFSGIFLLILNLLLIMSIFPLFLIYLWLLVRSRTLNSFDLDALENLSRVLHPLSIPITRYIISLRKTAGD